MRNDNIRNINEQCQQIEEHAANNSLKDFYEAVRNINKTLIPRLDVIKDKDVIILTEGEEIIARWNE